MSGQLPTLRQAFNNCLYNLQGESYATRAENATRDYLQETPLRILANVAAKVAYIAVTIVRGLGACFSVVGVGIAKIVEGIGQALEHCFNRRQVEVIDASNKPATTVEMVTKAPSSDSGSSPSSPHVSPHDGLSFDTLTTFDSSLQQTSEVTQPDLNRLPSPEALYSNSPSSSLPVNQDSLAVFSRAASPALQVQADDQSDSVEYVIESNLNIGDTSSPLPISPAINGRPTYHTSLPAPELRYNSNSPNSVPAGTILQMNSLSLIPSDSSDVATPRLEHPVIPAVSIASSASSNSTSRASSESSESSVVSPHAPISPEAEEETSDSETSSNASTPAPHKDSEVVLPFIHHDIDDIYASDGEDNSASPAPQSPSSPTDAQSSETLQGLHQDLKQELTENGVVSNARQAQAVANTLLNAQQQVSSLSAAIPAPVVSPVVASPEPAAAVVSNPPVASPVQAALDAHPGHLLSPVEEVDERNLSIPFSASISPTESVVSPTPKTSAPAQSINPFSNNSGIFGVGLPVQSQFTPTPSILNISNKSAFAPKPLAQPTQVFRHDSVELGSWASNPADAAAITGPLPQPAQASVESPAPQATSVLTNYPNVILQHPAASTNPSNEPEPTESRPVPMESRILNTDMSTATAIASPAPLNRAPSYAAIAAAQPTGEAVSTQIGIAVPALPKAFSTDNPSTTPSARPGYVRRTSLADLLVDKTTQSSRQKTTEKSKQSKQSPAVLKDLFPGSSNLTQAKEQTKASVEALARQQAEKLKQIRAHDRRPKPVISIQPVTENAPAVDASSVTIRAASPVPSEPQATVPATPVASVVTSPEPRAASPALQAAVDSSDVHSEVGNADVVAAPALELRRKSPAPAEMAAAETEEELRSNAASRPASPEAQIEEPVADLDSAPGIASTNRQTPSPALSFKRGPSPQAAVDPEDLISDNGNDSEDEKAEEASPAAARTPSPTQTEEDADSDAVSVPSDAYFTDDEDV